MQFCLLYRYDPSGPGPVAGDVEVWVSLSEELAAAGALVHEAGFFPASQAVSVAVGPDGEPSRSDGPPPGEAIAGYYTIQAADLDEAIAWAARMPTAVKGAVEIRQVVEFEG